MVPASVLAEEFRSRTFSFCKTLPFKEIFVGPRAGALAPISRADPRGVAVALVIAVIVWNAPKRTVTDKLQRLADLTALLRRRRQHVVARMALVHDDASDDLFVAVLVLRTHLCAALAVSFSAVQGVARALASSVVVLPTGRKAFPLQVGLDVLGHILKPRGADAVGWFLDAHRLRYLRLHGLEVQEHGTLGDPRSVPDDRVAQVAVDNVQIRAFGNLLRHKVATERVVDWNVEGKLTVFVGRSKLFHLVALDAGNQPKGPLCHRMLVPRDVKVVFCPAPVGAVDDLRRSGQWARQQRWLCLRDHLTAVRGARVARKQCIGGAAQVHEARALGIVLAGLVGQSNAGVAFHRLAGPRAYATALCPCVEAVLKQHSVAPCL